MSDVHDHDRGLEHDLRVLRSALSRRKALGLLAGASLLPVFGCGASTTGSDDDGGTSGGSCDEIPEETAGPYPGDGSNGQNALTLSGIVRSDIRSSLGSATGVAAGVPLTVTLTLLDTTASCAPLAGHAIYLWHCDRDGNYSMYSSAIASENYLRGVQETDADGKVTFTTIFPGCYSGRWPHMHFEVYPTLASATDSTNKIATSQLALPESTCDLVYATSGYSTSVTNLDQISLTSDNIFSDGVSQQLASVSGSVASGFAASLTLGI